MSALFDLVSDLELDGAPSDAWVAEHAPDGRLDALWRGGEALWMGKLASRASTRGEQVRAAIEIARRVSRHLPDDHRAHRAIERAEAWLEDESVDLGSIADDVWAVEVGGGGGVIVSNAVRAAFDPVRIALGEAGLNDSVLHAENAIRNGEGVERAVVQRELAEVVRRHVACPTLEALRAPGVVPPSR
jgi:hypothetical protein